MSAALRRSFSSLQIPNYRRYFAGQIVSLSGNWMQMVAEMWLILELTGSGVAVGVTSALQFLPILLFGAWGGVVADRFPKRSLLIGTQAAMAAPALVLWALAITGALIATVGVAPCFLLNAATFAAMIVALRGMDPERLAPAPHSRKPGGVGEAIAYVRHEPKLLIPLAMM